MGRGHWVNDIYLQLKRTLNLKCCQAVSYQFRVLDITRVALLVKQDSFPIKKLTQTNSIKNILNSNSFSAAQI